MDLWRSPFIPGLAKEPLADASVLTLGNFDGVHAGHRQLIQATVKAAKKRGLPSIALTFEPHPMKIISSIPHPGLLMTLGQKLDVLEALGISAAWVIPFSRDFSELGPDAFLRDLKESLDPVELHVGRAFRFGMDRSGDCSGLRAWGKSSGCSVCTHAYKAADGSIFSSSNVRQALLDGNVQLAAAFLGAPFRLTGIVVEGDRRGRCLGFPTANLAWEQELLPAPGVYATSAHCPAHWEGRALGLTNVGTRPTFKGNCMTVETFFPNFAADLYGAKLALDFLHRIRGEEKLSGAAELSEKIAHDVDSAVAWWKSARKGRPLENEKGQAGKFSGLAGGS